MRADTHGRCGVCVAEVLLRCEYVDTGTAEDGGVGGVWEYEGVGVWACGGEIE